MGSNGGPEADALAAARWFLRIVYERPYSRLGTTFDLSCRKLGKLLADAESADNGARLVLEEADEEGERAAQRERTQRQGAQRKVEGRNFDIRKHLSNPFRKDITNGTYK